VSKSTNVTVVGHKEHQLHNIIHNITFLKLNFLFDPQANHLYLM